MNGFDVSGYDVSDGAIQRASAEASKRGLSVRFSVADMVQLSATPDASFDAVICMDNSVPHLEKDEQLLLAAQQAYRKLRPGGAFSFALFAHESYFFGRDAGGTIPLAR